VRAAVNTTRATMLKGRKKVEAFARVRDLRGRASGQVSATSFGLTERLW
jgi:hypothetical protein